MLIVIPTRNRLKELINTLNFLESNKFFFKKILIVDSSKLEIKEKIKEKLKNYTSCIEMIDSVPSTCIQRNMGFKYIENNEYIMFLDDDNIFYPDALYKMQHFLNNNKNFSGVAFNQIYKEEKNILEKLKKNYILNKLGVYSSNVGGCSSSGWQSKFINFTDNVNVEWLPTRSVIYKSKKINNIRFDKKLGIYGYLEDLDFSLELKKGGDLMVCSDAKYSHDQHIRRSGFQFGKKELRNRYYIVSELTGKKCQPAFHWCNLGKSIILFAFIIKNPIKSTSGLMGIAFGYFDLIKGKNAN